MNEVSPTPTTPITQSFTCQVCDSVFSLPTATLAKFPGWVPKTCLKCKNAKAAAKAGPSTSSGKKVIPHTLTHAGAREENLTLAEVMEKYTDGPTDGVFTDGGCTPNPGPGGWGCVYVRDGAVVAQAHGHENDTTNNRMELTALLNAVDLVPDGTAAVIYSDSELCVRTMNEWAAKWEAKGWKRKGDPIKNLELVQEVYAALQRRPELKLEWIKAHNGTRWNEYADSLATAWTRETL
jgi:ribonuclease HI